MPHATKIATCCYCGTRAALTLKGQERHELACSACGAPLHDLKQLPVTHSPKHHSKPLKTKAKKKAYKDSHKPKKRKKSWGRWAAGEVFDVIEDIFD